MRLIKLLYAFHVYLCFRELREYIFGVLQEYEATVWVVTDQYLIL
jgi:hypothetical protein